MLSVSLPNIFKKCDYCTKTFGANETKYFNKADDQVLCESCFKYEQNKVKFDNKKKPRKDHTCDCCLKPIVRSEAYEYIEGANNSRAIMCEECFNTASGISEEPYKYLGKCFFCGYHFDVDTTVYQYHRYVMCKHCIEYLAEDEQQDVEKLGKAINLELGKGKENNFNYDGYHN